MGSMLQPVFIPTLHIKNRFRLMDYEHVTITRSIIMCRRQRFSIEMDSNKTKQQKKSSRMDKKEMWYKYQLKFSVRYTN